MDVVKCEYHGCTSLVSSPKLELRFCVNHLALFAKIISQKPINQKALARFWIDSFGGPETLAEQVYHIIQNDEELDWFDSLIEDGAVC